MPVGDLLPEIAVLVAAVAALLLAAFVSPPRQVLAAGVALLGVGCAGMFGVLQLGAPERLTFSGVWALDAASIWARLLILAATAVAILLAPGWLRDDRRHGEYYSVLLLAALGAMLLAGAADTLQLALGVLLSSVTGYTLAAYHRDWPLSVEAGMKYFLVGALANTLLMLGVALLFGFFGETGYEAIGAGLAGMSPSPLLLVAVALVVVGVGFKLAAVPAHAWLPDVAEGAPAPAAAFLTVVPKIGAAVALARLVAVFPAEVVGIRPLLAALAVATMTLGNLAALWQDDVRRLLGWSSVSQSGYALMAVAVVGLAGDAVAALLVFLFGYAAANLAAFGVVTWLRGRTARSAFAGLAAARPWAATVLAVALLSLVGIPPLAGFAGKLMLFLAAIEGGYAWLAGVAIANTAVSLFYYLRVIGPMYFGPAPGAVATLDRTSALATLVAGVAVVGVGLAAETLLQPLRAVAGLLP